MTFPLPGSRTVKSNIWSIVIAGFLSKLETTFVDEELLHRATGTMIIP
jgi:hypothetical protein